MYRDADMNVIFVQKIPNEINFPFDLVAAKVCSATKAFSSYRTDINGYTKYFCFENGFYE